jgi:N-methylhydantoinase B
MGGGGYGDPLDRPPELVARDVRMGCLLSETARTTYGVVVVDSEVDVVATDRERRDTRLRRLAAATVRKPSAARLEESPTVLTRAGDHLELVESDAKRFIRCSCGQVFCHVADNFKEYAALEESQLDEGTIGLRRVPELVMRRFYCPACAAQLWVDVAERDAPISFDVRLDSQA